MLSHPVALAADTFWIPATGAVADGGTCGAMLTASLVVSGRTSAIIGAGRAEDATEWADTVCSLVEADAVAWIVLAVDWADHIGGLAVALDAFPQASVAAPWPSPPPDSPRWCEVAQRDELDLGGVHLRFTCLGDLGDGPAVGVHVPERGLLWLPDLGVSARSHPQGHPAGPSGGVQTLVPARGRPVPVMVPEAAERGRRIASCCTPRRQWRSGSSARSS